MSPLLLPVLTFGAVAAAVIGIYSVVADLYFRDRSRVNKRIDDEFRRRQREQAEKSMLFKGLDKTSFEAIDEDETEPTFTQRLAKMIEQSGLDLDVRRLIMLSAAASIGLGAVVGVIRQNAIAGGVAAVVGLVVPYIYVDMRRKARLEKLLSQLPDAFDLMARVVRAGQTMAQAQLAVADEFAPPIAGEFSYCYEQQNLGLPAEGALRDLARRTGLLEIKIFVLALIVQQQTGGNLAELLEKLSTIIRDRYRIRGQIKTLTAESRLQALILLALPVFMFLIMMAMNREYASILLDHPQLIFATLGSEALGAIWIRSIVNFDF